MRHMASALVGLVVAPLAWVLLAFGTTEAYPNWSPSAAAASHYVWIAPLTCLLLAGLLLGAVACLRTSPVGAIVTGTAYLGYGVAALALGNAYRVLPAQWRLLGRDIDLRGPVNHGTAVLVGALLLVAAVSIRRWRRWPAEAVEMTGEAPDPEPLTPLRSAAQAWPVTPPLPAAPSPGVLSFGALNSGVPSSGAPSSGAPSWSGTPIVVTTQARSVPEPPTPSRGTARVWPAPPAPSPSPTLATPPTPTAATGSRGTSQAWPVTPPPPPVRPAPPAPAASPIPAVPPAPPAPPVHPAPAVPAASPVPPAPFWPPNESTAPAPPANPQPPTRTPTRTPAPPPARARHAAPDVYDDSDDDEAEAPHSPWSGPPARGRD